MPGNAKAPFVTVGEYLERDVRAETKSEYFDGAIVPRDDASPDHDRIARNFLASLNAQLRGTPCEPFSSDMRVRLPMCNCCYYPDVSVACANSRFENINGAHNLQNPALIVEVLSDSTEKTDRGDKLLSYPSVPSVQTYVIVAQDSPLIQVYERQSDNFWNYNLHEGLESTISLTAIGCSLSLAEVYARVEFRPLDADSEELAQITES